MPLLPEDWTVVVLGRWNQYLFTPAEISKNVFGLAEGTPVEVYLTIDDIEPPRVRHDGITVIASKNRLSFSVVPYRFNKLDRARRLASEAIARLPKTPLTACGVNVRYRAEVLPAPVADRFSRDLDKRFSDVGFEIVGRQFHRLLKFQDGGLLVRVVMEPDGRSEVLLNFELRSKDPEVLREWLSMPMDTIRDAVCRVMEKSLDLQGGDYAAEQPDDAGH